MKFYTRRRVSPVITIVSLVDILTMVLMFFVYTTTFKTLQPKVEIVLPSTPVSSDKPLPATVTSTLTISKDGDLFLNEKPIDLDALGAAVKKLVEENGKGSLSLRADTNAPFGKIMGVLGELRVAGVEDLPAFTQPK